MVGEDADPPTTITNHDEDAAPYAPDRSYALADCDKKPSH